MRALLGPLNPVDHPAVVGDLDGLDVRCFDRQAADVTFDPAREPLAALWGRLPADWTPDCLIWWSPEYSLVPQGIETCPVPSIAALGDWNLGLWSIAPLLEAFDLVVTDRPGERLLAPQLGVPVERWPMFALDPRLHRRTPAVERDIDVLFVGSLNPVVQVERTRWLARLARLGTRHRVLVRAGVYGEAYASLLRRARIVWNRSIRGELNMRAYEATASGALLFLEAENREVGELFRDGESCVLYDDRTLETRLEHALAHPDESARIAEAGWRRVQGETYRAHLMTLLARAAGLARGPRPFAALPAWRRHYWLGIHALHCGCRDGGTAAQAHLVHAATTPHDPGTLAAALGVLAAAAGHAGGGRPTLEAAASLLATAVTAHPDDVVSRLNLGAVLAVLGRGAAAEAQWTVAWARLEREEPFPLDRVALPLGFDRFRVEWERAAVAADPEARAAALRPVLAARVAALLAQATPGVEAIDWWGVSVGAAPGIDDNLTGLARALRAAGRDDAAAVAYRRLLAEQPFDDDARRALIEDAQARNDRDAAEALRTEGWLLSAALGESALVQAGA